MPAFRKILEGYRPFEEAAARGARDDGHHGTSAALECAVFAPRVDENIVMGHSGCSGIRVLMTDDPEIEPGREFIHPWIGIALAAEQKADPAAFRGQRQAR